MVLRSIASLAVITKSPERHCEVRSLQAFCHNFVKLLKYRAETLFSHTNALELLDYHFRTRSPAQRRSREKYVCPPLDRCASGTNIDRYMPRSRFQWPLACWDWVRIPPKAWMCVCCECCVLSGRGLCDELIIRPEESYRLLYVVVCDLETSWMRRPWPRGGCHTKNKHATCLQKYKLHFYVPIFKKNSCRDARTDPRTFRISPITLNWLCTPAFRVASSYKYTKCIKLSLSFTFLLY
jgi:hypothetical protein